MLLAKAKSTPLMEDDLELLGLSYMLRGTFFEQMHRLQITIGADYYTRRDTSKGFVKIPINDYYLGRYLYEEARYEEAIVRFKTVRAASALQAEIRQKAAIWQEASLRRIDDKAGGPFAPVSGVTPESDPDVGLELAFAESRLDLSSTTPDNVHDGVAPGPDYRLVWFAARNRALTPMIGGAERLISSPRPDYTFSVDGSFDVNFYEPLLFDVLANADYTAAAAAFEQVTGSPESATLGGICAYLIRDFDRSASLLARAGTERASMYLSLIENKDSSTAADRPPNGASPRTRFEWAALTGKHRELLALVTADRSEVTKDRLTLQTVSAALAAAGAGQEVVDLISVVIPAHRRDKDRIYPTLTAIETIAFLNMGDKDYRRVLDNLAGLIEAYPVVANVYDMLQGLAAPNGEYLVSQKRTG